MEPFAALADPNRRRILELLADGERSAGSLVEQFDISAPAVSQHLKTLREAGLVAVRIDGQRRIYRLDPAGLAEVDAWLQRTRRFWASRIDLLETELRRADHPKPRSKR